jgi:hypothetical protein
MVGRRQSGGVERRINVHAVWAAFWHWAFTSSRWAVCLRMALTYDATSTTYALSLSSPRFMLQAPVWKLDGARFSHGAADRGLCRVGDLPGRARRCARWPPPFCFA